MAFWILTGVVTLMLAAMLAMVVLRNRNGTSEPAAAYDLRVYRQQLKDLDRDVARGIVSMGDAERLRTEISRRILAADAAGQNTPAASGTPSPVVIVVIALVLLGGSLGLYWQLGAPGYGDLALQDRIARAEDMRRNRPDQATAEAELPAADLPPELSPEYEALLTRLRETVAARPDDVQGHVLLAQNEARVGNYAAAAAAQGKVVRLKGAEASIDDVSGYAELLVMAAGGYVSPEAEAVLRAVLTRDVENGTARYYWGLMLVQTGRPDLAFRMWDGLLRRGPEDAPWIAPILAQITPIATMAGVDYTVPEIGSGALRGPSAEDIDAAQDMSPAERMEMIGGMVESLSSRLASQGGPVEDWARLITSLGVLGETTRARAIYENAVEVFADDPAAMDDIQRAGERAGVTE